MCATEENGNGNHFIYFLTCLTVCEVTLLVKYKLTKKSSAVGLRCVWHCTLDYTVSLLLDTFIISFLNHCWIFVYSFGINQLHVPQTTENYAWLLFKRRMNISVCMVRASSLFKGLINHVLIWNDFLRAQLCKYWAKFCQSVGAFI